MNMGKYTTKKSGYRTVGAVSGHFPSNVERAVNAEIAEQSRGAKLERAEDTATIADSARKYLGQCPLCDAHVFTGPAGRGEMVVTMADCVRCALHRQDPEHWYIGEDGTWWAV